MIRKTIIFMLTLLPLALWAQYTPGQWKVHPYFVPSQITNLIDTQEKVYYLTSDNVFSFDKETQENEAIDKSNYLNDVLISNIYYNTQKDYLVIAYRNSGLDIILSDGKIVNMSEIKDAIVTSGKGINDITFTDNGTMLVATQFGYVVIDDSKFVVKESHVYYKNVSSIAQVGSSLVAVIDNVISSSPVSASHDVASAFISTGKSLTSCTLRPINGSTLFVNSASKFYVGALGGTAAKPTLTLTAQVEAMANNVQETPAGFLANFMSGGYYYTFDKYGGSATRIEGGNEMYSSYVNGNGTLWAVGPNGLHISGNESNFYKPFGVTVESPFWMVYNEGQDKVYVHTSADNFINNSSSSCRIMQISAYDGQKWVDETPDAIKSIDPTAGNNRKDYSAYRLEVNPKDSRTYVFGTRGNQNSGAPAVYKITNGQAADVYNNSNTPGGKYRGITAFDSQGNLWIAYSAGAAAGNSTVVALPSNKVNSTTPVVKSDWKKINVPGVYIQDGYFKWAKMCVSKNSDIKIYTGGGNGDVLLFWRGDINTANPDVRSYADFTDQDGKKVSWTYMRYMVIDKNDKLWFTTGGGIVSMNPEDAFTDNCTVNHIKVPRNDGTDLADYLLEGETINCIAVDNQNRKWIGTTVGGLYQVSEDGTQILQQFNKSNSMLPSNTIYSIVCTKNGSVFILTDCGLVEYVPGYSATSSDLSNVYCYPNPVRPDYTGLLTISGLTENALVKISDSAGNVIKQLKSAGGIATWDCCDVDGNRVATGVYYVLASTSGDGSSGTIVSKFLVVK